MVVNVGIGVGFLNCGHLESPSYMKFCTCFHLFLPIFIFLLLRSVFIGVNQCYKFINARFMCNYLNTLQIYLYIRSIIYIMLNRKYINVLTYTPPHFKL